jgi:hypothetical protein
MDLPRFLRKFEYVVLRLKSVGDSVIGLVQGFLGTIECFLIALIQALLRFRFALYSRGSLFRSIAPHLCGKRGRRRRRNA